MEKMLKPSLMELLGQAHNAVKMLEGFSLQEEESS
jgi:hypothetical protein